MEEFKSGKVRLQMMLDDSKDKVIKSLNPTLKTGRKWQVKDTISAKENLAFKEVIGLTQTGRQGLRVNEKKWGSQANGNDRYDMVIQEVRNEEDNKTHKRNTTVLTRSKDKLGGGTTKVYYLE